MSQALLTDLYELTMLQAYWSERLEDASALSAEAWPLVDPARKTFGGEPLGLVLAQRAMELAGNNTELQAAVGHTLAWANFSLGLDVQAREASMAALESAMTFASTL